MKKKQFSTTLLFLVLSYAGMSQVSIGKTTIDGDAILDFGSLNAGIILPWVTSSAAVSNPVGGTLIFDSSDKKIKYYQDSSSPSWVIMSPKTGAVDTSIQDNVPEDNNGVIIGTPSPSVSGVLVLSSTNKGLLLPKVANPETTILSPDAGTLVYDTVSKKVAVYNGLHWTFWGE
jgi:hypothetical protein